MKIKSINKEYTKDKNSVAFNAFLLPTEDEVNECNKYLETENKGIEIRVEDECLYINRQEGNSLNKEDIDFIVKIVDIVQANSKKKVEKEQERLQEEQLKRENMFAELAESLELSVE